MKIAVSLGLIVIQIGLALAEVASSSIAQSDYDVKSEIKVLLVMNLNLYIT
jgi:hypothetical protein